MEIKIRVETWKLTKMSLYNKLPLLLDKKVLALLAILLLFKLIRASSQ